MTFLPKISEHFKYAALQAPSVAIGAYALWEINKISGLAALAAAAAFLATYHYRAFLTAEARAFKSAHKTLKDPSPEIQKRFDRIVDKSGLKGKDIPLKICTHKLLRNNAFAIGSGEVWLGEDMMKNFSPSAVNFVLAHEVAHLEKGHNQTRGPYVWMQGSSEALYRVALGYFAARYVPEILGYEMPSIPAADYSIIANWGYSSVAFNWVSRHDEYEADKRSVELTGDVDGAISYFETISDKGMFKLEFMNTHPFGRDRVSAVLKGPEQSGFTGARITPN